MKEVDAVSPLPSRKYVNSLTVLVVTFAFDGQKIEQDCVRQSLSLTVNNSPLLPSSQRRTAAATCAITAINLIQEKNSAVIGSRETKVKVDCRQEWPNFYVFQ